MSRMIDQEILRSFAGTKALVTGGTGLVGRQVVRLLLEAGAEVTSVSLDEVQPTPGARYVHGDLSDFALCRTLVADMDFVFHIAGIKGSIEVTKTRPSSFFVPLIMMNTNVLEACRLEGVKRVVYTSSIGAYTSGEVLTEGDQIESGPPMDTFPGWAKRMAELQVEAYRIQYGLENFAVVRLCNVYGPGDNFDPANAMVIPSLIHRIHSGEDPVVVWGDGSPVRDFAYSEDVAEGVLLALYHGTSPGFVNLASGVGYSVAELVDTLARVRPFNYKFDTSKPAGFPKRVMDIRRARERLGYQPSVSLEEGLRLTWDWYEENKSEHLGKQNYFR